MHSRCAQTHASTMSTTPMKNTTTNDAGNDEPEQLGLEIMEMPLGMEDTHATRVEMVTRLVEAAGIPTIAVMLCHDEASELQWPSADARCEIVALDDDNVASTAWLLRHDHEMKEGVGPLNRHDRHRAHDERFRDGNPRAHAGGALAVRGEGETCLLYTSDAADE